MKTLGSQPSRKALLILFLLVCLPATHSAGDESSGGQVDGTVHSVDFGQIRLVSSLRITFYNPKGGQPEYDTVTDIAGHYSVDLPPGIYRARLHWQGDCSRIHRAAFGIGSHERLTFDFLIETCPITDTERPDVPLWGEPDPPDVSETLPDLPLARQKGWYQEQLFPAKDKQWPEIIVSFSKYDNQADKITYLSDDDWMVTNGTPLPKIAPKVLPVTVTADRYTLRALSVVLEKKTMVFRARGEVTISDGTQTKSGESAQLSFSEGQPHFELKP